MKWMIIIFSILITSNLASKFMEMSSCPSPCQACQRAVYQLKFHQAADCSSDYSPCRSTCDQVEKEWGSQSDNIFKAFMDDQLGKCDICFRANYCSLTECEAQSITEKNVINHIVSSYPQITGKKTNIIKDLDIFNLNNQTYSDDIFKDLKRVQAAQVDSIESIFNKFMSSSEDIDVSMSSQIDALINNMFIPNTLFNYTPQAIKIDSSKPISVQSKPLRSSLNKLSNSILQLINFDAPQAILSENLNFLKSKKKEVEKLNTIINSKENNEKELQIGEVKNLLNNSEDDLKTLIDKLDNHINKSKDKPNQSTLDNVVKVSQEQNQKGKNNNDENIIIEKLKFKN